MIKNYSNEFKFKVVMEAIKGELTIAEIISRYQVSKSVIHKWKKQFIDKGASVFNASGNKENNGVEVEKLHQIIGKLQVENHFLQTAWQKLTK